jgi:hypothetical protein
VVVFLVISAVIVAAAGAREQRLVLFYAVAVFAAFLCGLLAMAKFFRSERRWPLLVSSLAGAAAVAVTLIVNVARGYPIVSLAAALAIAAVLHRLWIRAGRPRGVGQIERIAEVSPGPDASS